MDESAYKQFLGRSLISLRDLLDNGTLTEIVIRKDCIFVRLESSKYKRQYAIKVILNKDYPTQALDFLFVNPSNVEEEGTAFWPNDNDQTFKLTNQNPPFICMSGTKAYCQRGGHQNPGPPDNLLENVIYSLFVKLNKE